MKGPSGPRTRASSATVWTIIALLLLTTTACGDEEAGRGPAAVAVVQVDAPSEVRVDVDGADATLRWSLGPGSSTPDGFRIYLGDSEPINVGIDSRDYTFQDLAPGHHFAQVAALDGTDQSAPSAAPFDIAAPRTSPPSTAPPPVDVAAKPKEAFVVTSGSSGAPRDQPSPRAGTEVPASTRRLTVNMALVQLVGYDLTKEESPTTACRGGFRGFDDIRPGAPITVKDGNNRILATGSLASGRFEESSRDQSPEPPTDNPEDDWGSPSTWPTHLIATGFCTYSGQVDVPDSDFYSVEVSHRGESSRSRDQLEESRWAFDLSLS